VQLHILARCFGRNFHQQNYQNIERKFARKPDKNFIQYDNFLIAREEM